MNVVTIQDDRLVVVPQGLDKLWSFRRRIDVPLGHVAGATFDPGANAEPKGLRSPGAHWPGRTSGTYRGDGEAAFWNVDRPGRTVVVELREERYARLVLSVEEPRAVVAEINQQVG